jgi:DNA-binding MarR family transcriptional regulator
VNNMRPPEVVEFLRDKDISQINQVAEARKKRDQALLRFVNMVLALNHEGIDLSTNALMVLCLVSMTPGIGITQLAQALRLTPGGTSKIIDQLSIGRVVRGERQAGLNLVQREAGQGCFLTPNGERVVDLIAVASEQRE